MWIIGAYYVHAAYPYPIHTLSMYVGMYVTHNISLTMLNVR